MPCRFFFISQKCPTIYLLPILVYLRRQTDFERVWAWQHPIFLHRRDSSIFSRYDGPVSATLRSAILSCIFLSICSAIYPLSSSDTYMPDVLSASRKNTLCPILAPMNAELVTINRGPLARNRESGTPFPCECYSLSNTKNAANSQTCGLLSMYIPHAAAPAPHSTVGVGVVTHISIIQVLPRFFPTCSRVHADLVLTLFWGPGFRMLVIGISSFVRERAWESPQINQDTLPLTSLVYPTNRNDFFYPRCRLVTVFSQDFSLKW
jgi:hypothetical protein